jgi:hypothetical protein
MLERGRSTRQDHDGRKFGAIGWSKDVQRNRTFAGAAADELGERHVNLGSQTLDEVSRESAGRWGCNVRG